MKKYLLLGAHGQLGWELERAIATLGQVRAFDFPDIDLKQEDSYYNLILEAKPDVILNAAAYTAVDKAEDEPEGAMAINARAPGVLAELAKQLGATLIHFSTDYVFDGQKGIPYLESDPPNPQNIYGRSKWLGEQAVIQVSPCYLILRTSWVYSLRRESFVSKVIRLSQAQDTLRMVTDQVGSPTWARMLAEATAQLLAMAKSARDPHGWLEERAGLYHLAGSGYASRFQWAEEILNHISVTGHRNKIVLEPAITQEFPSPARRPLFSALDCCKFEDTFGLQLPHWKNALQLAMSELS